MSIRCFAPLASALAVFAAAPAVALPEGQPVRFAAGPDTELAGTLQLPQGEVRAAVVLVSGNGGHARDQVISGLPMFAELAADLAEHGIATLRFDSAGVGESTGPRTAHFEQRTPHVSAALQALGARPELADVPLGLLGHSEGTLVANLVYAARPDEVDFLVLLSAPGARGDRVWVAQQVGFAPERFPDMPEGGLAEVEASLQAVAAASIAGDAAAVEAASVRFARATGAPQDVIDNGELQPFIDRMASEEMQRFLSHDPAPAFAAVDAPVLAVWGGADIHTAPGLNLPPLAAARHADAALTAVVIPAQDHFFMEGDGLAPGQHVRGRMRLSERLAAVVGPWIAALDR